MGYFWAEPSVSACRPRGLVRVTLSPACAPSCPTPGMTEILGVLPEQRPGFLGRGAETDTWRGRGLAPRLSEAKSGAVMREGGGKDLGRRGSC